MKNTNRALLSSVVALVLCCSMLIGSTFAWFTDEVTTGVNTIQAGNLDVELYAGGTKVDSTTPLFDDVAKWEPGVVSYENLTVANEGNLALKYNLALVAANENKVTNGKGLSEILKVAVVEGGVNTSMSREALVAGISNWTSLQSWSDNNVVLNAGETKTYGIVIYWQPSADDNDWNVNNDKTTTDNKPLWIDLGLTLVATQANVEEDSFNKDYDKDAVYTDVPTTPITGAPVYIFSLPSLNVSQNPENMDFTYYTFDAKEFQGEYPVEIYKDWICDYYVSTDKPVNDGLMLVGQYDFWDADNWYGFYAPALLDDNDNSIAYPPTPLLGTVTNGGESNWTYADICDFVELFKCGIVDTQGKNNGTNVTVELRMTSPNGQETKTVCSITVTLTQEVNTADELTTAVANGGLITLTGDIDMGATQMVVGGNVVLDLNGHDLTGAFAEAGHYAMFTVQNGASLTINGYGNVSATTAAQENNRSLALFLNHGTITINGGTYTLTDSSEGKTWIIATIVDNRTNSAACNTVLTINDGEFTVAGNAKNLFRNYPQQGGSATLTINDGLFHDRNGAVAYIWNQESRDYPGNLNFLGGTFDAGVVYEDYNGQSDVYIAPGVIIDAYSGNN